MSIFSEEHKKFLRKRKLNKLLIVVCQILIATTFIFLWELAAKMNWINTFTSSSPTNVVNTLINLYNTNNLFNHIRVTVSEVLITFALAGIIGFVVASILWWNKTLAKIIEPYLTIINSLPKVALGPLIIIWVGANNNSIIFMALLITTFITIINIYNGFIATDHYYITLLKTLGAKKYQVFLKLIVPANKENLINALKINISMSLIGVIMGELLVSKAGLGYLIMYGSQVFNINLVITAVVVLAVISYLMYQIVVLVEKKIVRNI